MKPRSFWECGCHVIPHLPCYNTSHRIPKPLRKTLRPPLLWRRTVGTRRRQWQGGNRVGLHFRVGPRSRWPLHLLTLLSLPLLQRGVPMVLHRIIRPTRKQAGNGGPSVAVPCMSGEDGVVLGRREGPMLYTGAELVAPPEPAGLPRPTLYVSAYQGPVSSTVALNKTSEDSVLLRTPRTLYSLRFVGLLSR